MGRYRRWYRCKQVISAQYEYTRIRQCTRSTLGAQRRGSASVICNFYSVWKNTVRCVRYRHRTFLFDTRRFAHLNFVLCFICYENSHTITPTKPLNNLVASAIWKKATNPERQKRNQHFSSKKRTAMKCFDFVLQKASLTRENFWLNVGILVSSVNESWRTWEDCC